MSGVGEKMQNLIRDDLEVLDLVKKIAELLEGEDWGAQVRAVATCLCTMVGDPRMTLAQWGKVKSTLRSGIRRAGRAEFSVEAVAAEREAFEELHELFDDDEGGDSELN